MERRLAQIIRVIGSSRSCQAVSDAIDEGMAVLYGGMRPLPTKGVGGALKAHEFMSYFELKFADALHSFVGGARCGELHGKALELKWFVEQMNEVSHAVGVVTSQCGPGDMLGQGGPCDSLLHRLNPPAGSAQSFTPFPIRPSFSVNLRSPAVPGGSVPSWQEDVGVTPPISAGSCVTVAKETRGLMVRVHLLDMTVVNDPWATPLLLRGTLIPVWVLEWVPSQYMKEWPICNQNGVIVRKDPITRS